MNGLVINPYPTCGYTHRAISGLLQLRDQHQFTANEIDVIKISMADSNAKIFIDKKPQTSLEARFSLEFCIVLAALKGQVIPSDFDLQTINTPILKALQDKIELVPYAADPNGTNCSPIEPDGVTVRLNNATEFSIIIKHSPGSIDNPITKQQHQNKYSQCIKASRNKSQNVNVDASQIESILLDFEHLNDVSRLTKVLGAG